MIIVSVNLTNLRTIPGTPIALPIPSVNIVRTPVKSITDGTSQALSSIIWGTNLNNAGVPIPEVITPSGDNAIILLACIENDNSSPDDILNSIRGLVISAIFNGFLNNAPRLTMVANIRSAMQSGYNLGKLGGFTDPDDLIAIVEYSIPEKSFRKLFFSGGSSDFVMFGISGPIYVANLTLNKM